MSLPSKRVFVGVLGQSNRMNLEPLLLCNRRPAPQSRVSGRSCSRSTIYFGRFRTFFFIEQTKARHPSLGDAIPLGTKDLHVKDLDGARYQQSAELISFTGHAR